MNDKKVLFVGGSNLLMSINHRANHLAAYLEQRFEHVDTIGFVNFYNEAGPSAPAWIKAKRGIANLLHRRTEVTTKGSNRRIVIRDIYTPSPLKLLVMDMWRYILLRPILTPPYDLAIVGDPRNAFLATRLKKQGHVKTLIYDDWDYFPGHITTVNNVLEAAIIKWRERICVRQADVVTSVSHALAELRKKQGAKKVLVVSNGVEYSLFQEAQQKRPHPPTLIFMGSLFDAWGVDLPIQALPDISAKIPGIRYLILGDGPQKETLQDLAHTNMKLQEQVHFLGRKAYEELPYFLAEADIGVLTYRPEQFVQYASSLKVFEYMAAGLPVIGTRIGDWANIIEEAHAGLLINFTPKAFAEAAVELLHNSTKYKEYAQNAVSCTRAYDWRQVFAPMMSLMNS